MTTGDGGEWRVESEATAITIALVAGHLNSPSLAHAAHSLAAMLTVIVQFER